MSRKDEIFRNFLEHEILSTKYKIKKSELPNTVREGLNSRIAIVKSMALIVENLEPPQSVTDKTLRDIVLQHLNQNTL
jgi:hypothetical protein